MISSSAINGLSSSAQEDLLSLLRLIELQREKRDEDEVNVAKENFADCPHQHALHEESRRYYSDKV